MSSASRAIFLLCLSVVLGMSVWFSATAVLPTLRAEFAINDDRAALFTSAVQFGYVLGTLFSAVLGLADRLDPRRFFAASALTAASANGLLLILPPTSDAVLACRLVTGMCMAGIYPVGMKMATGWAGTGGQTNLGLLIGTLVGALVLGSATPYLFNAFGGVAWRPTVALASGSAAVAALIILTTPLGPNQQKPPPFRWDLAFEGLKRPALRLANFGYLGHMWELYAMWAWIGLFLLQSFRLAEVPEADAMARMATFLVIGIAGTGGAVWGGYLADRYGRTALTMGAMIISGSLALVMGWTLGWAPWLVFLLCLAWGATVIADSAQFSSATAELAPPGLGGTMLTVQTCMGFLLTLVTIHLLPALLDQGGWPLAFGVLAIGPFLGAYAMWRLRLHPEAVKLAGGRK